ncbi:hypothetical protein L596_005997 [Steinernema carpocapsae]|uniref:Uncharacterized protein n=1 Tax=Steinernema carpocapsae TaxID=34508 RepID=A0A4U8V238_STECR|nr:hypothetical protein L596_005997 [Steinernema carpocapsae]
MDFRASGLNSISQSAASLRLATVVGPREPCAGGGIAPAFSCPLRFIQAHVESLEDLHWIHPVGLGHLVDNGLRWFLK